MLLPYMCQQQICPSHVIYMPHSQITQCAPMGKCSNTCAKYKLTGINHVMRNAVHKKMMPTLTVMTQPGCITWVGQVWKLLKIISFKNTRPSQSRNDQKSVFSRPLHPPQVEIYPKLVISSPLHPSQGDLSKISAFKTTISSQNKKYQKSV